MPNISVIVPVFNSEKFLNNCLQSIVNQTLTDFECIMIDDGSIDNSSVICKKYEKLDNRFHYFFKNNGGVASARNYGIDLSKSKYIVFIDSDDYVTNRYLEDLYLHNKFDYVISGCTHVYVNENDQQIDKIDQILIEDEGVDIKLMNSLFFVNGFFHSCCGKLYKKELLNNNDIRFSDFRLSEDSIFNVEYMKCIENWKVLSKANYMYLHRKNIASATKKFEIKDIESYLYLHDALKNLYLSPRIIEKTMFSQYYAILRRIANSNLSNEQKDSIFESFFNNKIRNTLLFGRVNLLERYSITCFFLKNYNLIKYLM